MYFDNLTIAGILVVALYGLLPLLFGREIIRVEADSETQPAPRRGEDSAISGCSTEPCRGA